MKIYRFDRNVGHSVDRFESNFIMSRIANIKKETMIGCMHLEENGVIGYHKAVVSQLLLIVSGEGWVSGSDQLKVKVKVGDAVFWEKGEEHETVTDTSLTAIVIESEEIHPEEYMPFKEVDVNEMARRYE